MMIQILKSMFTKKPKYNYPVTPLAFDLLTAEKKDDSYSIELVNDTETGMEFVVNVLMVCCGLTEKDAIQIMIKTHQEGSSVILQLEKESAEKLVTHIMKEAEKWNFPFTLNVMKT